MHVAKNLGDIGHNKGNQEKEDHASDKRHEDRIGQGRFETPPQCVLMFAILCQTSQYHIKGA